MKETENMKDTESASRPTDCSTAVDVEKQEEVVSALWEFMRNHDTMPHDINQVSPVAMTASGEAIHTALKRIMETFGYAVASIQ